MLLIEAKAIDHRNKHVTAKQIKKMNNVKIDHLKCIIAIHSNIIFKRS